MARKALHNPDWLNELYEGTDRGGQARTWAEVATIAGVSKDYARRVARGQYMQTLPKKWIDPREFEPQLEMTDQQVQEWNEHPTCMCGCGGATKQELAYSEKVPHGAYRLYLAAHHARMPWEKAKQAILNGDAERIRKVREGHHQHTMISVGIAEDLREWRTKNNASYEDFQKISGVFANQLRDIANGRCRRIKKFTAARILVALGEPLRPDIAREYRRWAKLRGITLGTFVVSK